MGVPEKHRAVAHEWVDGAEIQYIEPNSNIPMFCQWRDCVVPTFFNEFEYRIKPKTKVKKWRWVMSEGKTYWVTDGHYSEGHLGTNNGGRPVQKIDSTMIEVDE